MVGRALNLSLTIGYERLEICLYGDPSLTPLARRIATEEDNIH